MFWFRWSALVTWLAGAWLLAETFLPAFTFGYSNGQHDYPTVVIGIGAWLGTIMLFNVWGLIWPNQKKILGIVPATDEEKAKARKVALYASRTNFILSIPMLLCMAADIARPALLIDRVDREGTLTTSSRGRLLPRSPKTWAAATSPPPWFPPQQQVRAQVIAREPAILCGTDWASETFRQLDPGIALQWQARPTASAIVADQTVLRLAGPARPILTGERTALNFLQTLSATATAAHRYVAAVAGTGCRILDTRKTIPGLRLAQKYAARCGGAQNHRLGLYDMVLIKENHIIAAGSIGGRHRHGAPDFPRRAGRSRGGIPGGIRPGAGRRRRHHHAR